MLSHRSILAAVEAIGRLDDRRVRDADRVLQVLPMYHVAGWVVAFLPTTLVGGATVIPEVGFDTATISIGAPDGALRGSPDIVAAGRQAAESAVAAAGEHQVTVVPGAPGFFHHLVGLDGSQRSLATVRLLTSGTAPLDTDDFGAVQTLIGHPVWEGYGLSEAASVVASTLMTDEPRHGSVGKPLTGIELRIVGPDGLDVNADDAAELTEAETVAPDDPLDVMAEAPDAGEVGRIAIRGATLFSGYWPDGHGGPAADGWFVTGDIGYLDDDGELHLVDRASETVTVAGFTVYPREVEQVLGLHPGVAEAAVIGVPAAGGGEEVAAVLVARADTVPTVTDLADFVESRLPAFKRPAVYQLAPSLPRTEVGRLDRGAVLRNFARTPNATLPRLVAVGPSAAGAVTVNGAQEAAVAGESGSEPGEDEAVDVTPEQVADLDELGVRLPHPEAGKSAVTRTPTRTCSEPVLIREEREALTAVIDRKLPSSEAADLLDLVRDLVQRELAPRADKAEATGIFPREVFAQLGDLGLLSCRTRSGTAAATSPRSSTCRCWRSWPAAGRRWPLALACTCWPAAGSPSSALRSSRSGSCRRCSAGRHSARTACPRRMPDQMPGRCAPVRSPTATSTSSPATRPGSPTGRSPTSTCWPPGPGTTDPTASARSCFRTGIRDSPRAPRNARWASAAR